MNRASMMRRYLPLGAVVAVQLLIVLLAPSKPPQQVAAGGDAGTPSGFIDPLAPSGPGSTVPGGSGGPGSGPGTGPGATVPGGGPASTVPGGEPAGSTAHCVSGRQADPKVYPYAPPCVPKFAGDNGGKTYFRGVDDDTIKVVVYRGNLGTAVDAILTAQGSNPSDEDFDKVMNASFAWINQNYELYGRKIEVVRVNGRCVSVPPQYDCLRQEANEIEQQHKPFAFIWNTSLASPFFDEFSSLKIVNLGGWGFRDSFSALHRPYHWDVPMGGSQLVDMVSDWYCRRMYGGGNAKAEYAGDAALRGRNRVLGAISTDDPENKQAIVEFNNLLKSRCGAEVKHTYFYAQDITTAEQQKRAAVNKMRENPESTTVMCFCDLVAPIFLYQEQEQQGYFPENVMVATGFMDRDQSAQAYGSLPAPPDSRGKAFDNAFGLAQLPDEEPLGANDAARVFQAMGVPGQPYDSANEDFQYYAMLGALIQGAGPNLTPETVEAGASRMLASAPAGNTNEAYNIRGVQPTADYTWWDSLREFYWSTTGTSEVNGEKGTWVSLNNGRWFRRGEFLSGLIKLPAKPR